MQFTNKSKQVVITQRGKSKKKVEMDFKKVIILLALVAFVGALCVEAGKNKADANVCDRNDARGDESCNKCCDLEDYHYGHLFEKYFCVCLSFDEE